MSATPDLDALTARVETLVPKLGESAAALIRDLLTYAEQATRENVALRKPMQKHCASCLDAQCWGVRVAAQQQVASLTAQLAEARTPTEKEPTP